MYAASLLFSDDMMEKLTQQVMLMTSNSWFISLKPLALLSEERQSKVKLKSESFYKMSWRMAKVYIYQIL